MKNIITIILFFFSFNIYSQQMGFQVVYVEAEENSQDNITEILDEFYKNNKLKTNGALALERLRLGRPEGTTHRIVFLWELGNRGFEEGEVTQDENRACWSSLIRRIDSWAWDQSYAGRFLNFIEGDVEKYPYAQIWDIKPENPENFKNAQMDLVESLPEVFKDRFVGFGTYDVNRPDGATHWALVTGKDLDDHLKFANDLQTKYTKVFNKYLEDRGSVELVHNFTFENLRFYK